MGVVTASDMLSPVTQQHVARAVDSLVDEFRDVHSRETVERVMNDSVAQLAGTAEVDDFLATLAHRFTRERLKAIAGAHGPERALPDVLFVGLGDSGRGQIASALVTLRSDGRVVAHSAGRSVGTQVDPAVVAVMQELGVDLTEAYANLSPPRFSMRRTSSSRWAGASVRRDPVDHAPSRLACRRSDQRFGGRSTARP